MADPVNWRFDPFTETYSAVSKTNEDHTVPVSSAYQVRLYEVPRYDTPSSVTAVILVELDEDLDVSETDVDVLAAHYDRIQVNDVMLCDDEKMLVTSKAGSPTVNVTRGYGGTTPATHTDGTLMELLDSLTEISSGSPAAREFRVDYKYNTGLVLFNSAQASYDIRFDYYGLGTPFHTNIADFVRTVIVKDEAITNSKIKFSQGSYSESLTANSWSAEFSLNAYSHWPYFYTVGTDLAYFYGRHDDGTVQYKCQIYNDSASDHGAYIYWDYHSSSPRDETWLNLSVDGKEIIGIWKSQPVDFCPLKNEIPRDVVCFTEADMAEAIKEHGKNLKFDELDAGKIMDNIGLREIILAKYKKDSGKYRKEKT